ncbi:MCP four helix bundle domain-containing protein, partial [Roseospira navarrensis]
MKIGTKLYGGFGVVLALLIVLGVTASLQLSGIGGVFNQYEGLASSTNEIGRVQANVLEGRMGVKDFIIRGDRSAIDQVHDRLDAAEAFIDTTEQMTEDAAAARLLDGLRDQIDEYRAAFERATDLQDRRNELFAVLNAVGPEIERTLTEIMRTANDDNDAAAAYQAGLVLRHLLLARLYVMKFMDDNLADSAARAEQELDAMDETAATLVAQLDDDTRQRLARKAMDAADAYHTAFTDLVDAITRRNAIISGTLDVIGPAVAQSAEDFKLANKDRQDTLGGQAMATINQTILVTVVIAVVAVGIGVAAAWVIGRGITVPILAMTHVMDRLSHKDYDTEVPAKDHKDEVGVMAQSVQIFKESMQKADALAAEQAAEVEHRQARAARIEELNHEFDMGVSGILEAVAAAATQLQSSAQSMASIAEET